MPSAFLPDDDSVVYGQLNSADFIPQNAVQPAESVFGGKRGNFTMFPPAVLQIELHWFDRSWSGPGPGPAWPEFTQPAVADSILDALDWDFAYKTVVVADDTAPVSSSVDTYQIRWRIAFKPQVRGDEWNFLHLRFKMESWEYLWDDALFPETPASLGALQDFWWNGPPPEDYNEADRLTWPGTVWYESTPDFDDPPAPPDGEAYTSQGWHKLRIVWPRYPELFPGSLTFRDGLIPCQQPPFADVLHPKFGDLHVP